MSFHIAAIRMVANTGTYMDAPFHYDAVVLLVTAGVLVVGIDSLNIDDVAEGHRPAHHGLLGAGIPIVEHLTALEELPDDRPVRLTVLSAPVRGMGAFPVRAVALVENP